MITILFYVVLGGSAWLVVGGLIALGIGAIIRNAENRSDDADLMALVQPESLSPAERDRQVIERSWFA